MRDRRTGIRSRTNLRLPPTPLRLYGVAAGKIVGLLRDKFGFEGHTHRLAVGLLDTDTIKTVAFVSATPEGVIDAERNVPGHAGLSAHEAHG